MTWEKFFSIAIRFVFLFAFAAFLWASIHHIATFYANFEPGGMDMTGSYALAISVDGTALILTIGVMFFSKSMPWYAKIIVWFFIFALTAFSWVVNWEYAARFQSPDLTSNPTLVWLNPILASSFAFLNVAYAVVSEFFNFRIKSVKDLQEELDGLDERLRLESQIKEKKNAGKKGFIERAKETALEVKNAVNELRENEPLPEDVKEGINQDSKPENEPLPEGMSGVIEPEPTSQMQIAEDVLALLKTYPKIYSWLDTGQKTAALEDVIAVTNHSKKMLTNRLNDGTLKRSPRNQNLILISSVIEWLKVAPNPGQNGHETAPLEVVKLNGTH